MKYRVEAIEKFVMRTVYEEVEADSEEEANRMVKDGEVSYDYSTPTEYGDEFLEVVSCEMASR